MAVSKTQAAASLMTMSDSVQRAGESINPIIDGEPRDHGRTMTSDEELSTVQRAGGSVVSAREKLCHEILVEKN